MTLLERRNSCLKYAYDIEGQALAARTIQEKGELMQHSSYSIYFDEIEKYNEAGCDWYVLPTGMVLYAGDCNEDLMQTFIHNRTLNLQRLHIIETLITMPDVFWGKQRALVAAVLLDDERILYKSPGFNLEAYQKKLTQQT